MTASAGSTRLDGGRILGEVETLPPLGVVRFGATLRPALAFDGADGDGYSNLAEFDSGTSPKDAASHPRVEWVQLAEDGLRLKIVSLADRDYVLESRQDLPLAPGAPWQPVRRYRGTGGILEVEATPSGDAGQSYYRLRAVPMW